MDALAIGTLLIRLTNAVLWTIVAFQVVRMDKPVPRLVRQLITSVIILGMWVLCIGSLTQFGILTDVVRPLYTAFTAYSGIIALSIVTSKILHK